MNYLQIFAEWSTSVGRLLLNHLWQATLFSAVALAASLLLRRGPARARYLIWLAASIKFALPSAIIIVLLSGAGIDLRSLFNSSPKSAPTLHYIAPIVSPIVIPPAYFTASSEARMSKTQGKNPVPTLRPNRLGLVLGLVWLTGSAALLCSWQKRRRKLSLAIKAGRILCSGREWDALNKVILWLGVRRRIGLVMTPQVKEPGVWRVLRPVVLLPEEISGQLSEAELESLMMHEMAHVLRWDNLVSNLNMWLCCLFWFNPIVWLIDKCLLKEREEACDEVVLRWGGAGEIYASSIRKIYRFCLSSRVSGLSAAGGSNLKRRLERIVTNRASEQFCLSHKLLVVGVIMASVTLSIIAGMTTSQSVVARTNLALQQVATKLVEKVVASDDKECRDAEGKKCLPKTVGSIVAQGPLAQVDVRSDSAFAQAGSPIEAVSDRTSPPNLVAVSSDPKGEAPPLFQSAHAVDLKKFVGRYAVDPGSMENFVFDVSLEDGELWLKPSHSEKHRLVAQSNVDYQDSKSPNTKLTFNFDSTGNVESFTLRGWEETLVVLKLVLPPPSLEGNITFRLQGFANAHVVAVAGTFNNWNQSQYLFSRVGGEWICRIHLPPGRYQYKFIVDGDWLVDPRNRTVVHDERDIENSELIVRNSDK